MKKILLVEDDKGLQEIYGVRLEAEGYKISFANNGEEAISIASKERFDLVLSDIMMPKISGFDMLDILKTNHNLKDTKIIVMTALSSEDQRAKGDALGVDKYLVKSQVGIEDVINAVNELLQKPEQGNQQVPNSQPETLSPTKADAPDHHSQDQVAKSDIQDAPQATQTPESTPSKQDLSLGDQKTVRKEQNANEQTIPAEQSDPVTKDTSPIEQIKSSLGISSDSVPDRNHFSLKDIIPPRR